MELEITETTDAVEALEPDAKRPRLSTMRVGAETLLHVDVDADEYFQQLEELTTEYPKELVDASVHTGWDYDNSMREMSENDLWQPFSSLEPMLDAATMERIDLYADQVGVDRLLEMGVITIHEKFSGELGTQLSAKFVRCWRQKTRKTTDAEGNVTSETPGWLRRLVYLFTLFCKDLLCSCFHFGSRTFICMFNIFVFGHTRPFPVCVVAVAVLFNNISA